MRALLGPVVCPGSWLPTHPGQCLPQGGPALYSLPSVKAAHSITATWALPSLVQHYRAKPEDYLSHLVGHEGQGSLLAGLKQRGWATGLSAGVGEGGMERNSGYSLFDVSITLTDSGLAAGPGARSAPAPWQPGRPMLLGRHDKQCDGCHALSGSGLVPNCLCYSLEGLQLEADSRRPCQERVSDVWWWHVGA